MRPTDDERREVARRLRELPIDMYEVEELWEMKGLDTCCKDQTDYYLIHSALFGCFPADHMHPCDYEELHARLADLIDPQERTCHAVRVDVPFDRDAFPDVVEMHQIKCSECGSLLELDWRYCPQCGSGVVYESA